MAVFDQKGAHALFGCSQVAIQKQGSRTHHFGRQRLECHHLGSSRGGPGGLSGHAVEPFQHAPADGQCRIHAHGLRKSLDRLQRLLACHVALATFLVQPTESGMEGLQGRDRVQCRRNIAELALRLGAQVQHVAILRHLGAQLVRLQYCLGITPGRDQIAQLQDPEFYRRGLVHMFARASLAARRCRAGDQRPAISRGRSLLRVCTRRSRR